MKNQVSFGPEEEKLIKKWLFWNIKIPATIIIYFLFILMAHIFLNLETSDDSFYLFTLINLISLSITIFLSYISYYNSYKTSCISFYIYYLYYCFISSFNSLPKFSYSTETDGVSLTFFLINYFINIAWTIRMIYLSWKFKKIIQKRTTTSSKEYFEALSIFQSAATWDELNNQYDHLIKNQPEKTHLCIGEAYNLRKQTL